MTSDENSIMVFRGWFVQGLSAGRGIILLRPEYVAFVPTETPKHLGAELVKGVAFSAAGIVEIGGGRRVNLDEWADGMNRLPSDKIDGALLPMVETVGGVVWRREEAKAIFKNLLLRRKKALWFKGGKGSMRANKPLLFADSLTRVKEMLRGWKTESGFGGLF